MSGLKEQVTDIISLVTNIGDVIDGLVKLGKAFYDDPKGTMASWPKCSARTPSTPSLTRIFHQGRARVGCDAVRWQGVTTLRARAREEEQRRQRAAARLNRVRSARYKLDLALEAKKVSIHAVLRGIGERPGEICGLKPRSAGLMTWAR